MTCRELAEKLMETPELSVFTQAWDGDYVDPSPRVAGAIQRGDVVNCTLFEKDAEFIAVFL